MKVFVFCGNIYVVCYIVIAKKKGNTIMAKRTVGGEEVDPSVYSNNYTEFTVKKKPDAKILLIRAIMLLVYVSIPVGIFLIPNMWWLGALSCLLVIIVWYFTWPFTIIEYEYTMSSGNWRFETNYGSRRRVVSLEKKIKEMKKIAPFTGEDRDLVKKCAKVYDFRSGPKHTEDIYFATFEEDGKDCIILFQCTNKAMKILKSYNKENTVTVDTLRY